MPGRKKRTNFLLLLIAVVLCLSCGYLLRQSSSDPPKLSEGRIELFAGKKKPDSETASKTAEPAENAETPASDTPNTSATAAPTATATPTPAVFEVSPEASKGVWTSSGSNWLFLVDGKPHTGWLTDTDGKRYYFNKDGIMQTGWVDADGKRYYMDLDGIMQTGFITTGGKSYQLLDDGSLKGYESEEAKKQAEAKKSEEVQKSEEAKNAEQTKKTAVTPTAAQAQKSKEDSKQETPTDKSDSSKAKQNPDAKQAAQATPQPTPVPKYIALTFDDGPSSFTDRLLDCLEKNNAKATFFMVGKEVESFPDEVKRMEALGCELGNHTYSHTDLTTLSPEGISSEIAKTDELLLNLAGHGATVVRPPYGSINDSVRSTVGTPMILWSIDTLDWETQDAQQTVDTVLSQVEDGSIILMHDIFSTSVDAAEILVPELIKQGYNLVTVHELAKINGIDLQPGTEYGDLKKQS